MTIRTRLLPALAAGLALAGCSTEGDLVLNQGVGISAVRSTCPAVGIPDYTGDITTFRAPGATTQADLDVTAAITNLRSNCNEEAGDRVYTEASFDVVARRSDTTGSRTVTLPYFSTVLRGGSSVVSKRVGNVTLQFADGQERAQARRPPMSIALPRRCPRISASRSPASANRAIPTLRSIRWPIPRCGPQCSAPPSNCWWVSS